MRSEIAGAFIVGLSSALSIALTRSSRWTKLQRIGAPCASSMTGIALARISLSAWSGPTRSRQRGPPKTSSPSESWYLKRFGLPELSLCIEAAAGHNAWLVLLGKDACNQLAPTAHPKALEDRFEMILDGMG